MEDATDVLIVGAGPVGLALANDLAERGVRFQIIDPLSEPTRNSRAHGLQSRTLEVLDRLNLAEPLLAAAQHPQPVFEILSGGRRIARLDFADFLHAPYPYQLIIWQQRVEQTLAGELERRGHQVERGVHLASFTMDDSGVDAELAGSGGSHQRVRAAWIVGCDGGHSRVRETLGLKMQGTTVPGCFWLGEVDIDWRRSRDTMYEWWHDEGDAGAIYIDFTRKWHVHVQFHTDDGSEPDIAKLEAAFRKRIGDDEVRLSNPAWMGRLMINQRMPARFMAGRALLAGDAAHVHSAAGGQGMNTGIQDALNLGWKLALATAGAASPSLLASYEAERLPNARNVLRAAGTYHHIEIPHGVLGRWIGGAIFRGIESIRPFGNAALARVGMLDLNYSRSPLSRQDSDAPTSRTRAGWHVPDVSCRIDGRATHLFEVLRGTRAHLFLFAGTAPGLETFRALASLAAAVAPYRHHLDVHAVLASESDLPPSGMPGCDVITDGAERMQVAFGLHASEMIYVRPDGYIGLRSNDLSKDKLLEYLALIYAAPSEVRR